MIRSIRYEIGVLTLSLMVSLTFYFPTWEYGMVSDFLGWMLKYKNGDWSDVISSFGYHGLHPFFHLINFSFWKIFGLSTFSWYLFFSILHGVNGYLVFKIAYRISNHLQRPALLTAATAGLLFLLIPYQMEVVTWKACMHYLIAVCLFCIGFLNLFRWADSGRLIYVCFHHIAFFLGLMTLEIHLASPFIYAAYFLVFIHLGKVALSYKKYLTYIGLPHLVFLISYFGANVLLLGEVVGHYGAEQHLQFDPDLIFSNSWHYFIKYAGFMHFFPDAVQHWFYGAYAKWWMILACIIAVPITIKVWKSGRPVSVTAVITLAAFFMGLVPVITLWFNDLTLYENDRYGYFASIHFTLFIAFTLSLIQKKRRLVLTAIFLSINVIFLGRMLTFGYEAGTICKNLLDDYKWEGEDVLFMAAPQNYNGLYMYGNYDAQSTSFKRSLELLREKEITGSMADVAHFNMKRITDRVDLSWTDDQKIKAGIAQGGTWFWRKGLGLKDTETNDFIIDLESWFYTLEMKDTATSYIYLTVKAGSWEALK